VKKELYQGKVNYHKVISDKYWQIKLDKVLIDGIDSKLCSDNCKVILDTGSSLVSGPPEDVYSIV
jgi:cathepsin D